MSVLKSQLTPGAAGVDSVPGDRAKELRADKRSSEAPMHLVPNPNGQAEQDESFLLEADLAAEHDIDGPSMGRWSREHQGNHAETGDLGGPDGGA